MRVRAAILMLLLATTGCRMMPDRASSQRDPAPRENRLGPVDNGNRGYTRSYDPKSGKIELVPTQRSNRIDREQVLVATIFDRDGNARRRQRVEWMIEGPGSIVEVDERGGLLGRGRRVDGKYAYSYTDNFGRTVSRTNNPREDFEVQAGQTWCIVSSAVEGETRVTAYAPDIFDTTTNKVTATLTWVGGGTRVSPETSARPDAEMTARPRANERIGDGLPPIPNRETGVLTSRGEEAQLTLDVKVPATSGIGQELPVTIALANNGTGTSQPLTIRATLPDDVEFVRANPVVSQKTGNALTWSLDGLNGNSNRDLVITVRPTKVGSSTFVVRADSADGTNATKRVTTQSDAAGMTLKLEGETFASAGDVVPLQLTVTNTGSVPLGNAVAWVELPEGFSIDKRRGNPVEVPIGKIAAQESRTVAIPVSGNRTGKQPIKVTVTGDGGLVERAETTVTIGRAELEIAITSPDKIPVGQSSIVEYRVANRGDSTLQKVEILASIPRGFAASSPTDSGRASRESATWNIGTLPPGESKVVRLNLTGDRIVERSMLTATAEGELSNGGLLRAKKATAEVSVTGLPILTLELADPSKPVPVGGRAVYRVTVRNRGNATARDVEVSAEWSGELRGVRGTGPNRTLATLAEKQLSFPKFDLPAGSTATFVIDAEGKTLGTAHVVAQVQSQEVTTPVREEQITRVVQR